MNRDDITILRRGVKVWNAWRTRAPDKVPDLDGAILSGMSLRQADLRRALLRDVYFNATDLTKARLGKAQLQGSDLRDAILRGADLTDADLRGAHVKRADLRNATLVRTDLRFCALLDSDLSGAKLVDCKVYGLNAWGLKMVGTTQRGLVISNGSDAPDAATITVHEVEAAQIVHLLLHASKIGRLIDAVNSKLVLILGRFKPQTKRVLDAVQDRLRTKCDYVAILFDFERPQSKDYIEPVLALAQLSRFIVADLTDPKIILEELARIVPNVAVPVQPIMRADSGPEPTTIYNLRQNHRSVLPTYCYRNEAELMRRLDDRVIQPAEDLVRQLLRFRIEQDPLGAVRKSVPARQRRRR